MRRQVAAHIRAQNNETSAVCTGEYMMRCVHRCPPIIRWHGTGCCSLMSNSVSRPVRRRGSGIVMVQRDWLRKFLAGHPPGSWFGMRMLGMCLDEATSWRPMDDEQIL